MLALVVLVAGGTVVLRTVLAPEADPTNAWLGMSPVTGVGLLVAAASVFLLTPGRGQKSGLVGVSLAGALLALGALTLASGPAILPAAEVPSPQSAIGFVLLGACLCFSRETGRAAWIADGALILLLILVLFAVSGHVFGAAALVEAADGRVISPPALLCLTLLGLVVGSRLAVRGGALAIATSIGLGGRTARTLIPFCILLPFGAFGVVAYLDENGLVDPTVSRAAVVVLLALTALAIVNWMGRRLNSMERQLRVQSVTDELTQIPNRRGFMAVAEFVLHSARRSQAPLTAMFFDLDGLKIVNDTRGHAAGSQMIKRFAELLATVARKSDVIGRVGGDEFVLLAAADLDGALEIAFRLRNAVDTANGDASGTSAISYSMGVAELSQSDDVTIERLVARADAAMYEDKRRHKGRDATRQRSAVEAA
jgi:diguanylate cyclase (GGDEF)-like protein